jgi:uncharacterized protein YcfJ
MTQPLAQGELLYVTDDQRLFIGNGNTPGGVQITGYTNEDAQDATALLFSNGAHTGITFTYNDAAASISAVVDLANYQGTIGATSFKGSIVADDSTLLVDGISGKIVGPVEANVTGNVTGNLTGNVIGNITGVITGTAGSTIVGNVTGNVTGNTTGNTTGYHTGDVKGSVFADDSSIIVDAVSNSVIAASVITGSVQLQGTIDILEIGTAAIPVGISITAQENSSITINSRTDGLLDGGGPIFFNGQSGTYLAPLKIAAEGTMGGLIFNGYNGTAYQLGAAMIASVAPGVDTTGDAFIASDLVFLTSNGIVTPGTTLTLRRDQVAESPCFRATPFADATARTAAIASPQAGMIAYITSTNKLQAYNGSGWQDLF